jgi:phenylacetate-CoA ligase
MSNSKQFNYYFHRGLAWAYYGGTGRGEILRRRDEVEALYYSARPNIEADSRAKLAALLSLAKKHVPYYRDIICTSEITPDNAPQVLGELPILTKPIIREQQQRLVSELPGRRVDWNTSGGSTGEPIRLLQDLAMGRESRSYELLFMKWAGHRMGEPHVLLWGVPNDTLGKPISAHERLFRYTQNQTYLNCYGITDALLDEWVTTINRIKPTLIEAYVDACYELSKRVLATNQTIHSPTGLITSAGVLTPEIRATIQRAFRCPVVNRYGSREVSNVACSCGQSTCLHVNEAMAWLEIVDKDGKACPHGVEGDVLVTLFTNRTMPLIRYRIEDRGTWDASTQCVCGRNTQKLVNIVGRRNDFLVGRDGIRINGVALTTLLYPVNGIRQYQFRQASTDRVVLAVVPVDGVSPESLQTPISTLTIKLQQMLKGTPVEVKFEGNIKPSNSGKYRYVLNEISASNGR